MRVQARVALALVFGVLAAGCSAFTPTIENEPITSTISNVDQYRTLEVQPIVAAQWVDVKAGDRDKIRKRFIEKLRGENLRLKVVDSVPDSNGVIVLASFLDYNDRMVVESRGRMRIHVSLIDKARGDTLSQTDLRSKTIHGWFATPDDRRTGQAIAARLIDYMKDVGLGTK